ncbi:MAG: class I adenylate-forming enzyme family protein [Deferribacterota bacterium]|nr:class I adenylate-forming enzyme family protein [Deferribacterota bacterium]
MILVSQEQIKKYEDEGVWIKKTLLDTFKENVRENPDRLALIDPPNKEQLVGLKPERLTYQELDKAIDAVATALLDRGVKKDDIIVAQLPNICELAMLYLAVSRAGGILSPLPVQWREKELRYILNLTKSRYFISVEEFHRFKHLEMGKKLQSVTNLQHLISLEELKNMTKGQVKKDELNRIKIDANDVFNIEWTSGTEAEPKGCPMSHNNWRYACNGVSKACLLEKGDTILCLAPLVNMTAIGVNFMPWLAVSGTFVLHHPIDPVVLIKQIIEEKVNFTIVVPAILNGILKHPDVDKFDFSSIRSLASGSAPLSLFALKEFKRRWGIELINIWGQNEGTGTVSGPLTTPELEKRVDMFPRFTKKIKWGIDPVIDATETKIVDTVTGEELSNPGDVGELLWKGPFTIPCYFNQPDFTEKAFEPDGFFHTGDLFMIRDDRYMSFFDRKKDIIIRGGFNISAQEVENILLEYPKIQDVAAIPMPDEIMGEKVCVYVVPKGGETITLEEITSFMKEQGVTTYKLPERLEIIDEIPRNPVGKILKQRLKEDIRRRLAKK